MTLAELLNQSIQKLETARVYNPRKDAVTIFSKILTIYPEDVAGEGERVLTASEIEKINKAIARREKREPVARIFDGVQFFGLPVRLEPGVFEPLFESENLVEHALLYLEKRGGQLRVLDLGTGTGCLLLAVLSACPRATGVGVDINEKAIDLARRNAARVGLEGRAEFITGDWTKNLKGPFDLIISNPPYIPKRLIKTLVPEVREHDPHESLIGGRDGMHYFRLLARDFRDLAAPDAMGFFQVSLTFAEGVKRLFQKQGFESQICRNYFGIPVGVSITNSPAKQTSFKSLFSPFSFFKTARSG